MAFIVPVITAVASAAVTVAPAVAVGVGVYSVVEQQKAKKEAEAQAAAQKKAAEQEAKRVAVTTEKQAGEYFELTEQQMELQAQMGTISTLADLVSRQAPPTAPRIFTTPAPVEYSTLERINIAIGDLLRMN